MHKAFTTFTRRLSMASALTTLDGSTLEGGGQILRNATTLSALLAKPIEITNVRDNRKPPGLRPQHAAGLRLVADICGASAEGIDKGSRAVLFAPGPIRAGDFIADPGTAGSTTLLLQVSLPCLLFPEQDSISPTERELSEPALNPVFSTLTLRGGTNALNAPPIDYTEHIFLPFLFRHFALSREQLSLKIKRRGYYPHGGGDIRVRVPALVKGQVLPPVTLTERGEVTTIRGISYISGPLSHRVATEMRDAAVSEIAQFFVPAENSDKPESAPSIDIDILSDTTNPKPGSGIILWAETSAGCAFGATALGSRGTAASAVGREAGVELVRSLQHGGCVDEYMQDQMIIFLALARGTSNVKTGPLTLHTRTAIWVAESMTAAKFTITDLQTSTGQVLISCEGIGLEGRL